MLPLLAGVIAPALVGASLGSFQSADILAKDRNVIGLAGQIEIEEGDADRLTFPAAEAWYRLGLGFGDFGVKLARGIMRGSLKVPVPIDAESFRLSFEPAASIGEWLYESDAFRNNTLNQGVEASILVSVADLTVAPRAAVTFFNANTSGNTSVTRGREWLTGGTIGRRIKGEHVDWWGEIGIYRGMNSDTDPASPGNKSFLLFAPGIGASIEF